MLIFAATDHISMMEVSEDIAINDQQQVEYEISLQIANIRFCGGKKDDDIEREEENAPGKTDTKKSEENGNVQLIVTWSGHVFKLQRTMEELEKPIELVINLRTTHTDCSYMLSTSSIMIKLYRSSQETPGVAEVLVSECFCNSILCKEFSAQTLDQDLKYRANDDSVAAKGSLTFIIRKLADGFTKKGDELNLVIDDDVAKKFQSKANTFCENFKVTQSMSSDCRKMLEEFYSLNF